MVEERERERGRKRKYGRRNFGRGTGRERDNEMEKGSERQREIPISIPLSNLRGGGATEGGVEKFRKFGARFNAKFGTKVRKIRGTSFRTLFDLTILPETNPPPSKGQPPGQNGR